MKTIRRTLCALLLFSVTAGANAADLGKYKNWDESPEGYFMTKAEREAWKVVATSDAAEQFVAAFREKRGGDAFVKEVAKRVEMADKYLTIGKVKGSTAVRGKLVILFGPPAAMEVTDRKSRTDYSSGSSSLGGGGELGVTASAQGRDGSSQAIGRAAAGTLMKDYKFSFSGKNVPALGGDLTVVVEVDAGTGKDRLKEKKASDDLEARFEAVAQSMLK